jgi:hypothetical protein
MSGVAHNDRVEPNPERGFRLDFNPKATERQHDFCGPNEIGGAACPNCSRPLLRLLSLSSTDTRLNVNPAITPAVHLLYCWTCSIPYGPFSYRIHPDGTVEILEAPPANEYAFGPDGPYDGYTGDFSPRAVGMVALSNEEQDAQRAAQSDLDLAHNLPVQAHQVGGFPMIFNSQAAPCPRCSKLSPFLAVICDDASGNHPGRVAARDSFTGNMGTQMVFHLCHDCSVVSAYQSND